MTEPLGKSLMRIYLLLSVLVLFLSTSVSRCNPVDKYSNPPSPVSHVDLRAEQDLNANTRDMTSYEGENSIQAGIGKILGSDWYYLALILVLFVLIMLLYMSVHRSNRKLRHSRENLQKALERLNESHKDLHERYKHLEFIIKHSPSSIAVYVRDLRFIFVSDSFRTNFGLGNRKIIGEKLQDVFPDLPQKYLDVAASCLTGSIEQENDDRFIAPDGSVEYIRWVYYPWYDAEDQVGGIVTFTEFVTFLKEAEIRLQSERDRAQNYLNAAATIMMALNRQGRVILLNRKGEKIMGYSESELLGKNWLDICVPEVNRIEGQKTFNKLISGEIQGLERFKYPIPSRSGARRIISWHNTIVYDENGRACGLLSSGLDITEKEKARQALVDSERRYHNLFNFIQEGIGIVDQNEVMEYFNPGFARIFDIYDEKEMVGKSLLAFVSYDSHKFIAEHTAKHKAGRISRYELEIMSASGLHKTVLMSVSPMFYAGRYKGAMASIRDISDLKKYEKRLEQNEQRLKMALEIAREGGIWI